MRDTPRANAVEAEIAKYKRNVGGDAGKALKVARELERELAALRGDVRLALAALNRGDAVTACAMLEATPEGGDIGNG